MTSFADFNLIAPIAAAIKKAGYKVPTPIQEKAIPHLLQGRDLLGIAQTGTGKTAAFALPMLQYLATNPLRAGRGFVRSLILTPTRELASQISASFATYGQGIRFRQSVIFGGVGQQRQVYDLSGGLDVLTATPGRLLDLMSQGYVRLDNLEIFVLDEADRMLDMGFIHDIRRIISHLPSRRQTLLFSATMPSDIAELAQGLLTDPVRVEATPPATTVETVEQQVLFVDRAQKIHLLTALMDDPEITMALVFTRTKHGADKVVRHLQRCNVNSDAIHGNKSQNARERALARFRTGQTRVLVATDIAARGIDVPGVSHVINFDLPNEPESYIHRIGRTARAGRSGMAISLCDAEEKLFLEDIQKLVGCQIPVDADHRFHSAVAAAAPPLKPLSRQRGARSPVWRDGRDRDGARPPRRQDGRFNDGPRPPRPTDYRGSEGGTRVNRAPEGRTARSGEGSGAKSYASSRPRRRG
jgi:ATP-dependent RNA helicase RhlE